jgi:hypothetical protein
MMNLIEIHEVLRKAGIETVEELERRLQARWTESLRRFDPELSGSAPERDK